MLTLLQTKEKARTKKPYKAAKNPEILIKSYLSAARKACKTKQSFLKQ